MKNKDTIVTILFSVTLKYLLILMNCLKMRKNNNKAMGNSKVPCHTKRLTSEYCKIKEPTTMMDNEISKYFHTIYPQSINNIIEKKGLEIYNPASKSKFIVVSKF